MKKRLFFVKGRTVDHARNGVCDTAFLLWSVSLALWFVMLSQTACGDGGTCNDCSCNPTLCDGRDGGDGGDGGGGDTPTTTVTLRVETWTLSSNGTQRDLTGAAASVSGRNCTTPCEIEIPTGSHSLKITLNGWLQDQIKINATLGGINLGNVPPSICSVQNLTVRCRLDRDISGWRGRCVEGCNYPIDFEVACAEKNLYLPVGENPT